MHGHNIILKWLNRFNDSPLDLDQRERRHQCFFCAQNKIKADSKYPRQLKSHLEMVFNNCQGSRLSVLYKGIPAV